jgi:hypothetical protein
MRQIDNTDETVGGNTATKPSTPIPPATSGKPKVVAAIAGAVLAAILYWVATH